MTERRGGQTRHLLLRAIGEFTVVVLGVLVALGVDAWVDDRADRIRETELLESLAADLRGSLEALEADNAWTGARIATLEWFLRFPVEPGMSFPEDSIPTVTHAANVTAAYAPTLRTYETMIATGTFDLISSPAIRLALADVKSESQVYSDYRLQATQQWNDTYAMTWLEHMGSHRTGDGFGPESVPNALPARSVNLALRDPLFRAVVDRRRIFLFFVADYGGVLADRMETALKLIETELRRRRGAADSSGGSE